MRKPSPRRTECLAHGRIETAVHRNPAVIIDGQDRELSSLSGFQRPPRLRGSDPGADMRLRLQNFLPAIPSPGRAIALLDVGSSTGRQVPVMAREIEAMPMSRVRDPIEDQFLPEIVPGATHLFEEPGTLERVAALEGDWFARHLQPAVSTRTHRSHR
jgi:hypothetical protein